MSHQPKKTLTKNQLYGHQPPITKTIQVRWTRHAGHCWRSRDKLISDVLLWTPTYGRARVGRPVWTYIQQLCEDMGCSPEDLPEAMNNREKWRESVQDIRACGTTWWWWWYVYKCHGEFNICGTQVVVYTTNVNVTIWYVKVFISCWIKFHEKMLIIFVTGQEILSSKSFYD